MKFLLVALIPFIVSQEQPGCFSVDGAGRVTRLDHLCVPESTSTPTAGLGFEVQEVSGIELSAFTLSDQGEQRFVAGIITNRSDSPVEISSLSIQFLDKDTNTVITSELFALGQTRLAPGQSREFRSSLSDLFSLGLRTVSEIKIEFLSWD